LDTRGSETRHSVGDNLTRVTEFGAGWTLLSAITLFLSLRTPIAAVRIGALTSLGQGPDPWQG
jgi:hypothetical protein